MKTKRSVYKQCAAAIDRIVQEPLRVFTEIDVATEAATSKWGNDEYVKSLHDSNEICAQRFRQRKLCRYGPVAIGRGKNKVEDYARIAGKIVYADAVTGPKVWKTPNGTFKQMMPENDHLSRQGRNSGANRNDAEPWSAQALPARPHKPSAKALSKRDLEAMVTSLSRRVQTLERQAKRQNKSASPV